MLLIGWSKLITNQKHYQDLSSDASSVWNFCARFSDVISRGNHASGGVANVGRFPQAKDYYAFTNNCGTRTCQYNSFDLALRLCAGLKHIPRSFQSRTYHLHLVFWIFHRERGCHMNNKGTVFNRTVNKMTNKASFYNNWWTKLLVCSSAQSFGIATFALSLTHLVWPPKFCIRVVFRTSFKTVTQHLTVLIKYRYCTCIKPDNAAMVKK